MDAGLVLVLLLLWTVAGCFRAIAAVVAQRWPRPDRSNNHALLVSLITALGIGISTGMASGNILWSAVFAVMSGIVVFVHISDRVNVYVSTGIEILLILSTVVLLNLPSYIAIIIAGLFVGLIWISIQFKTPSQIDQLRTNISPNIPHKMVTISLICVTIMILSLIYASTLSMFMGELTARRDGGSYFSIHTAVLVSAAFLLAVWYRVRV